jgi:hypothetical protein
MIADLSLEHGYLYPELSHIDRNILEYRTEVETLRINLSVARHNQAHIMAESLKRFW